MAPLRRQRKPAWTALALFLILACGGIGLTMNLRAGERVAVLAVARPVAVGHPISDEDLGEARISLDPRLATLPASERSGVVGQVATVNLRPGTLLTRDQFSARSVPASGQAVVGVALKPGQMPAEQLKAGDLVMVVRTPAPAGTPSLPSAAPNEDAAAGVLVPRAEVLDLRQLDSGDTVVSLVVGQTDAARVSRAQVLGQVSLVLLPAGP